MTTFPTTIDTFTTHAIGDTISPSYDNDQQSAIVALQTKVGVTNSADSNSIDYCVKNPLSVDIGHKHTLSTSAFTDVDTSAKADGYALLWNTATSKWIASASSTPNASTTLNGITRMSVAPVSAVIPIVVGDNDPRVPTQNENDALVGTSGSAVSSTNKLIDNSDSIGSGNVVRRSYVHNGGDGSDGALTVSSGTTNIDLGGVSFFVKNYSTISITGTGKVTFTNAHANGTIIVLKSKGDVTLTSSQTPMIDASALGTAGGTAVTATNNTIGNSGIAGATPFLATTASTGGSANGSSGGVASAPTVSWTLSAYSQTKIKYMTLPVATGGASGGVTGTSGPTATSGSGGRGGGTLVIECGGAWNFTTASGISVAGVNGGVGVGGTSNTAYPNAGGGGGGAGGYFLAIYNTLTANSGTVTTTAGTGGNSDSYNSLAGRAGGAGGSLLTAGSSGSSSNTASAKTGGDGATGVSTIMAISDF